MDELKTLNGRAGVTVEEFRQIIPISITSVYQGMRKGEIPNFYVGGRRYIRADYVRKLAGCGEEA